MDFNFINLVNLINPKNNLLNHFLIHQNIISNHPYLLRKDHLIQFLFKVFLNPKPHQLINFINHLKHKPLLFFNLLFHNLLLTYF
mmetsp:Transcript_8282/g.718  ORF Transcript_8282/g.718 Transcript_8282/m.718 type:complete len:85 (-) Transcript_8282:594-848(-)